MVTTLHFFEKTLNELIRIDSEKYGYGADYIIHIRYRYRGEKKWTDENELLLFTTFDSDDRYEWQNDWWEGQQELELLGFIRIENVEVPNLF